MNDPHALSPGVASLRVRRLASTAPPRDEDDAVAVEAPLEIRLAPGVATVLLRTPGDDEDLVHGHLLAEGIVASASEILAVRGLRDPSGGLAGSIVEVELAVPPGGGALQRFQYSSSSCGACGKSSLAALAVRGLRPPAAFRVAASVIESLPALVRSAQPAFGATGGQHAAALATAAGELTALREDVGRHNALDKLIGWASREGRLPLREHVLVLSGRASFELLQKAVVAGVPVVAAVGAPSSLAVEIAREFGVTLAGFVRGGSMNVYAAPERITP